MVVFHGGHFNFAPSAAVARAAHSSSCGRHGALRRRRATPLALLLLLLLLLLPRRHFGNLTVRLGFHFGDVGRGGRFLDLVAVSLRRNGS